MHTWLLRCLPLQPVRRPAALWLLGVALVVACSRGHGSQAKKLAPILLAQLALAPGDLAAAYVVDQEGYRDQNGGAVTVPSSQYVRQLRVREPQAAANPATRITVSVDDLGVDNATDFIDAADDASVGPPNLDDYITAQIAGSHDVHAELIDDFPTYDDDTVANRLSWQQTVNGVDQTWQAYGVYVRSGGLLAFVAVRASTDAGGPDAEALRRQAEALCKKQADKLKNGSSAVLSPR